MEAFEAGDEKLINLVYGLTEPIAILINYLM